MSSIDRVSGIESARLGAPRIRPSDSRARAWVSRALASVTLLALMTVTGCFRGPGTLEAPDREEVADALAAFGEKSPPALANGWNAFTEGLEEARRGIEDPALHPPAPSDRNRAEGYRYLLGHLARIIEAETQGHPDFPYFQRSVRMLSKWTIDNPDTLYLSASIAPYGRYRIRGRALDTSQWRTSKRGGKGRRAPRVAIFQTTTAVVGQTGSLDELRSCRNQTLDSIDQFELEVDDQGRFEIFVGPDRPQGYTGHYLSTRTELPCQSVFGTTTYRTREATQLNVREIFSDWRREMPLELEIVRLDMRGAARAPRSSAEMGLHLSTIGRRLANQIKFWNALHEFGLEVNGDRNGDDRIAFPLNDLNQPSPPFIAGGTAGAGQLYSAGTFELGNDEALVVRVVSPVEPHYVGFQLANLWGESTDQRNYVSSATGSQNPVASDGARYYIVSARDPGTGGWVATTGLPKLTMSMRFIFRADLPRAKMPTIETFATKIGDVRDLLPEDFPNVSPTERKRQVDTRQRHIQRRWRQY